MRQLFGQALFALVLVAGSWALFRAEYSAPATPTAVVAVTPATVAVDPTAGSDKLTIHTGAQFWGIHLGGVVPCSTMIVKGGGHLIMLAPASDPEARSFFHVRDRKTLDFCGQKFELTVVGPDEVAVERKPSNEMAAVEATGTQTQ